MSESFFVVGRIVAPWGIQGEVKVEVLTDNPKRFSPRSRVYLQGNPITIERTRRIGKSEVVKLAGVDTRNAAEELRGLLLEVTEADLMPLQPGEYYEHQIIGLQVLTKEGTALGEVTEVLHTGSNDVYIVRGEKREYLIPAIADVVRDIDLDQGKITIEVIPGLLE